MRRNRLLEFVAIAVLGISATGSFAQVQTSPVSPAPAKKEAPQVRNGVPQTWKQVPIPPLPAFKPQEPTRIQLPNGMVIFLQENHELPLIRATARIRGGSRSEPADKAGMIDMYGDVWRTGGTEQRTGDALDDFLEARAAKVETGSSDDSTSISLSCLKQDFDDVFAIFTELLEHPAFRDDKLALEKFQMNTDISRRNDDTDSIAGREAVKLAYGADNPYARVPEYATVAAVTRQDLLDWHKQHVYPNNIIFGIVGDFNSQEMAEKLRKAFGSLAKGPAVVPKEIEFTPAKPGIYLVNKTDVNQSEIDMVGLGIERKNPDYFAVVVMNEVFGGGFSSRLFSDLRTKEGLAYSVGGGIGASWDHPGITSLDMGTKSSTTVKGIQGLWDEMDNLRKNPPTPAELQRAKDSILNSFIFSIDKPEKVLRERMAYEFYGYPADWLERFRTAIDKVTVADVRRVVEKYVHKEQLAVLVVGNAAEFGTPLTTLGPVQNIDITIPPPAGTKPSTSAAAKPEASNPEGKALMAKAVQFLGGAEKLKSIKALRFSATTQRPSPQGEMSMDADTTIVYPDKIASILNFMGTPVKVVITPTAAFQAFPGRIQDIPSSARADAQQTTKRDTYNIAQHADDPSYIFAATGTEKIGDVNASVLDIRGGGTEVKWYLNPVTGELLRTVVEAVGPQGPTERTSDFGGWKMVDGVNFYTERTVKEGGEVVARDTVKQWTINPQVDPKLFERPIQ